MKNHFEEQLNDYYQALENRWLCVYAELDHRVFSLQSEYRGNADFSYKQINAAVSFAF